MTTDAARVVIIGGGFGGLTAAQALAAAPVDVTVIDRHNYHYFQPLLYQVATAALSPADIAWPIRGILKHQKNAVVLMAKVTAVDPEARIVHAESTRSPMTSWWSRQARRTPISATRNGHPSRPG